MSIRILGVSSLLAAALAVASPASAGKFLFDTSHHEMAGNADWVIDADAWNNSMMAYPCSGSTNESYPSRYPTPAAAGITAATPETYWTGGISAWGVDLVKAGHEVEQLPPGGVISFGNGSNPQDLSNYDVFILVEPQTPFTAAEKTAILNFVQSGKGFFMVADHETSDRDCDNWDSPNIYNDLTGATSGASAGTFGIWFRVDGADAKGEDWFDDGVDANVETNPADPIINGPFGSGAGGLGFFGATSMDIDTSKATAHVWRTGQIHNNLRVTFATATYGGGRVAAIGDSSPADDDTGDPSDSLYPGWDKATGGVKNREIHLNACAWLLNAAPDTVPPVITVGPDATEADCSALVTWTTDENSTSVVQYEASAAVPPYDLSATGTANTKDHSVVLPALLPGTTYHYRVASTDASGNGPTYSSDGTFTTLAATPPAITVPPAATSISGSGATITWGTDEPASSQVEYGTSVSYGQNASVAGTVTSHAVPITGLSPETLYHYRVISSDACGHGPTYSADQTFTAGPASIDVSGWQIRQFNSTQTYTIPSGTTIPSGGYLVVARDASLAQFQAFFPSMPAATVFLNSNATGSCAAGCLPQLNGAETFELWNGAVKIDGPTVSFVTNKAFQRTTPGAPAGNAGSWSQVAEALANPGQGAGAGSGVGVVINEYADASDYTKEFVELYYDANVAAPDSTAPAAVTDLRATPTSSTTIRLDWTATGDDGSTGLATAYDMRYSTSRIRTDADFTAATPLTGEPVVLSSGLAQTMTVSGLTADTPYWFALKVSDEVPNVSTMSNVANGVTGLTGSTVPVNHLVISQISIGGTGTDIVELYNPTSGTLSTTGMSLQNLSSGGANGFQAALPSASIPSHKWYLVAYTGYVGADSTALGTNNFANSNAHVVLVSNTTGLTGCTDADIVDKVGYGSGSCPEGGSGHGTANPTSAQSVSRKPGGTSGNGQDTDDNSADFFGAAAPSWHTSASAAATPALALGNVRNTLFLWREVSGERFDWGDAFGATGYRVYRGQAPDFMTGGPAAWQSPTGSTLLDPTLPVDVDYYVVRASDGTNVSSD